MMSELLTKKWALGFHDRGMGHGDFAVVTLADALVVECESPELAEHIIELHNRSILNEEMV